MKIFLHTLRLILYNSIPEKSLRARRKRSELSSGKLDRGRGRFVTACDMHRKRRVRRVRTPMRQRPYCLRRHSMVHAALTYSTLVPIVSALVDKHHKQSLATVRTEVTKAFVSRVGQHVVRQLFRTCDRTVMKPTCMTGYKYQQMKIYANSRWPSSCCGCSLPPKTGAT